MGCSLFVDIDIVYFLFTKYHLLDGIVHYRAGRMHCGRYVLFNAYDMCTAQNIESYHGRGAA